MKEASKAMTRRMADPVYKTYFTGAGVDIGCGDDCVFQFKDSFPMESCREYDLIHGDGEACFNLMDQSFDFLHSSHCLEHLTNPYRGVRHWIRTVKVGGYLVITVPDEEMYEKNQWPSIMNTQHKWSFRYGGENPRNTSLEARSFFSQFKDVEIISIKRLTEGWYPTDEDLTKRTDTPIECAIEIVLKKHSHTYKPVRNWALNGFCFMLNSLAMGDVIASVPVIKHMVETYYHDEPGMFLVVAKKMFRDLFPFIQDRNWRNYEDADNDWGIPKNWALGVLNQKPQKGVTIIRNTPKSMSLSQFAAFKLTDMLLDPRLFNYVPLPKVDISRFNHNFSRSVVLVTTYRDVTRMWHAEHIMTLALWIKKRGYTPVFIGKTDMNQDINLAPKSSLPANLGDLGLDLRNNTTIPELATIIGQSAAIVGLDSGPIHLAGTTATTIVCGYTTVAPEYRIPIRKHGESYAVVPDVQCKHCESYWAAHYHNYEKCYLGDDPQCCREMTADRFIAVLKNILK